MSDRNLILERLKKDLVGPMQSDEILTEGRPGDVYLTGVLWPQLEKMGEEESERLDSAGQSGSEDESQGAGEEVPLNGTQRPCTAGMSFAVSGTHPDRISLRLTFGMYVPVDATVNDAPPANAESTRKGGTQAAQTSTAADAEPAVPTGKRIDARHWKRRPQEFNIAVLELPDNDYERIPVSGNGIPSGVVLYVRSLPGKSCRLVTVTVINEMKPLDHTRDAVEECTLFQVQLEVRACSGSQLVKKPAFLRGDDAEEAAAALLYHDCLSFGAGHTCSAEWETPTGDGITTAVRTTWIPQFEVPPVTADADKAFQPLSSKGEAQPLEAAWLARASRKALEDGLNLLVACYSQWIAEQKERIPALPAVFHPQAAIQLKECIEVRDRLATGVAKILTKPALLESFRLANLAIQRQHEWKPDRPDNKPFRWRPFQLAFVLLAGPSSCDAENDARNIMDLLWFPTGGGKTEAYLGIIAMTAFYRRLAGSDPDARAGVTAIMRYTLRLLTTQQFVRAAALILACESFRRGKGLSPEASARLGTIPFSIGLWLGGEASPNDYDTAAAALAGDRALASPEQLLHCPCCHTRLKWSANRQAKRIEVRCEKKECLLAHSEPLPVWTVDSDVYQIHPTLLIGTIDKFAQLPRRPEVRALFSMGTDGAPDLIIQDELHLISGPLGTIAGLYEVAFDWLLTHNNRRPKVIGSTATIRRAHDQVLALFNRDVAQFPPPGIDHTNSGFAVRGKGEGRMYVGVTTAGRSAKFSLQAVAGSLLQSAHGGMPDDKRRDPYQTLVAYFNSLRELGGALVLVQDDVADSLKLYAGRRKEQPRDARNIEELTSRRTQEEVRDMLDKLAIRAGKDGCVDVVLATNMVSVGVDIPRLALMMVNGQPKTRSEYIQATSRVGRDKAPGLVVCLLNSAKPRDRSHYETFPTWHQTLYRDVEATSVTPFASRARDRGMRAVLVTMLRHHIPALQSSPRTLNPTHAEVMAAVNAIVERARLIDQSELTVREEIENALLNWQSRRPDSYWNDRKVNTSLLQSAERAAAMKAMGRSLGDAWPTMNNMRSVEPSVPFRLAERLRRPADQNVKDSPDGG